MLTYLFSTEAEESVSLSEQSLKSITTVLWGYDWTNFPTDTDETTGGIRYNTRSNRVRVIKTPGGNLRYLHIKKRGSAPRCGDCKMKLPGVSLISYSFQKSTRRPRAPRNLN